MSLKHFPRKGDKVNDRRRMPAPANGFVAFVLYDDGPDEVAVRFERELVFYDFEEFRFTWTDHFGGVFELGDKGSL